MPKPDLPEVALPLFQMAWVVPDIEAAARGWVALGVGPFFTFEVDVPRVLHRGQHVPLRCRVALAQAGPTQIELICPHGDEPSPYRDMFAPGEGGLHHVCREYGGYDETRMRLAEQGIDVVFEGVIAGVRFCFADTRAIMGCMLELAEESQYGRRVVALVRDASLGWDGRDPIRPRPQIRTGV